MKQRGLLKVFKNNMYMLRLIWKASPTRIFLNIMFSVVNRLMTFLFFVLMLRYVLNSFSDGTDFRQVMIVIGIIGVLKVIFSIFENYFLNVYVPISDQQIHKFIQEMLMNKAREVDISCYEDPKYYDGYVKALSESDVRSKAVIDSISNFVGIVVYIALTSYVILTIDPVFFLFIFIPIIAGAIIGKYNNKVLHEYNMLKLEIEREKDYTRRTFYLKEYSKEIRLTNISKVLFRRFQESIHNLIFITKKFGKKLTITQYLFFLSNEILTDGLIFLYASYKTIVNKTLLLGDYFVVIDVTGDIAWSFRELVDIFITFENNSLYIDNLIIFMEYEPKIEKNPNGKVPNLSETELKLVNVGFQYEGEHKPVLKNINLEVKKGQKIALVGHNGAGKSTLIKLILRLYDASEGIIYFNGTNIREYNLDLYQQIYRTVFQDFKTFSLTIAENVLLTEAKTEEQIKLAAQALEAVGLHDKVNTMKYGMHTTLTKEIAEDGVEISGGEMQKIAISRVFAKGREGIVILDEPTSALDPIAEFKLFEDIFSMTKDRTVIFISHRMFSAMMADYIYLLEDGRIIGEGTHGDLMRNNPSYADMFKKQAEEYVG